MLMNTALRMLILVFCWVMLTTAVAQAQLRSQHTQYLMNYFLINPSLAGIDNDADIQLGYRRQWSAIAGAPATGYLTFHTPIRKPDHTNYLQPQDREARRRFRRGRFNKLEGAVPHHGVGATFVHDQAGSIRTTSGEATYAFHLPLDKRTKIAAGLSLGVSSYRLEPLVFAQPNDPTGAEVATTITAPQLRFGLSWYRPNLIIGIAANQLIRPELDWATASYRPQSFRQSDLTAFVRFRRPLSKQVMLVPSVLLRYVSPLRPKMELQAMLYVRESVWLGAAYRHLDSTVLMAGLQLSDAFSLNYAYDVVQSRLRSVAGNSHEFVIGMKLTRYPALRNPRLNW